MNFRKTEIQDLQSLMQIFERARRFMRSTGNPNQWAETYPSREQLLEDISAGVSYVCVNETGIVATFVLRGGNDPTYDVIYDGAWLNDNPYATIHRIASSGEVRGVFREVMRFALEQYDTIRIDTHRDNKVMQHLLRKSGFEYCGIIHCWNGDERLAYQLRDVLLTTSG